MGFKDNINQDMWGNPDDSTYLNQATWYLYSPYKSSWFTSTHHNFNDLTYKNLMYIKALPPIIDETICPWGINANSGIGEPSFVGAYLEGGYYRNTIVSVGGKTTKKQKPAFITFSGSLNTTLLGTTQSPIADTFGYIDSQSDKFSNDYPSDIWGYNFINNLKYNHITVLPVIIACQKLDSSVINPIGKIASYQTSDYFYNHYPNQPQFTVWEYFNGVDSEGVPYIDKYPSILGVYACIFYQIDGVTKIPNLNLSVFSQATDSTLKRYPIIDKMPTTYMSYIDYVDYRIGQSVPNVRNVPHYLSVIGHVNVGHTAYIASSSSYPRAKDYDNADNCEYNMYYDPNRGSFNRNYYTHLIPDKLRDKFKTGIGDMSGDYIGIGWYEGLTEVECYQHIAYTGLPFLAADMTMAAAVNHIISTDNTTTEFRHSLMYPDFSANMVTTGTYAPYATSDSPLRDITWLFDIEQNYDPEYIQEGDESGDDYEQKQKDKGALKTTYHNNTKINGFAAYIFNSDGIKSVKNIINAQLQPPTDVTIDDWIKLDWYGQDPGNFILAVNKFPCDVNPGLGTERVIIGRTKLAIPNLDDPLNPTPLYGISARSQIDTIDFGTLEIKPYYNDFRDYTPYTNYIIHIPYLADYTLDPKIWLNHTCTIKIDFDIVTCNAMAEIWRDDMWYDTIYGTFGTPIPFLSYNTGGYQNAIVNAQANLETSKNAMTQSFLSTAVSVASTGVGIATGNIPLTIGGAVGLINTATKPFDAYNRVQNAEYNLRHTAPNPTGTSGVGGVTSLLTRNYCTLIISRPQPLHYSKTMYGKTIGFACCETGRLNNYHGLTVCSNTRFNSFSGTQSELAEIQQLLNTGVILP